MIWISELQTERLTLRQWKQRDYEFFAKINADPAVMRFYPATLSESESNSLALKIETLIRERGWGLWAVELGHNNRFIGFVGLHKPELELPFNPCVEIGWRLSREHWGNGYATEAGHAALRFAFEELSLSEVLSFASVKNARSLSVMKRLGMVNTRRNFDHPSIPVGNPHREHVLYQITKERWNDTA